MTPYDRAWDMGSYTEYMWSYDGICQVVRISDASGLLVVQGSELRLTGRLSGSDRDLRPGDHDAAGVRRRPGQVALRHGTVTGTLPGQARDAAGFIWNPDNLTYTVIYPHILGI
jgi:hypothetical protein